MKYKFLGRNKNLNYLLIGIILIFVVILSSTTVFANPLDSLEVNFEKEYYSLMEDQSIALEYSLFNNSSEDLELEIYSECEDDEIDCDYYKQISISKNSTRTDSFYVNAKEDGDGEVELMVRDSNNNEETYYQDIDVFDDLDDGEFSIDVDNSILCVGKENSLNIEIDNKYSSNLYNLSFKLSSLNIYLEGDSTKYLPNDEKDIEFLINVPKDIDLTSSKDIELIIENEEVFVLKEIGISFKKCDIDSKDFRVTSPADQSLFLEKGDMDTLTYNIINESNTFKKIYISEQSNENIDIILEDREVELSPNDSKEIDVNVLVNKDISSGQYILELEFFDGLDSIEKEVNINVEAEYEIYSRLLQTGTIALDMGKSKQLELLIENTGDISEDFEIDFVNTGNPIDVDISEESFRLNPSSTNLVLINLNANINTREEEKTYLQINISGLNSDYFNQISREVLSFRDKPSVSLDFFSIPRELNVDQNSSIEFEFEVFNFYNEDLLLETIEIRGLPQDINYNLPNNLLIKAKSSKVISGSLDIGDLEDQNISAEIAFISSQGGVLTKPLDIIVGDLEKKKEEKSEKEEYKKKKSFISGLFSFGNSIAIGIIILCLLIILLYASGVFKRAPLKARQ